MKQIPIYSGGKKTEYVALVDDEDEYKCRLHKWFLVTRREPTLYARTSGKRNRSDRMNAIEMHRFLFPDCPEGLERSHKDGNGLNNQRSNVEFVTRKENLQHKRPYITAPRKFEL